MCSYASTVLGDVAFVNTKVPNALGEILAKNNLSQLRIAETEKYAHVTYFFDGGDKIDFPNEEKILIPSPKVATYDLKPTMSAKEITEIVLQKIDEHKFDVIILNFANCDMVGHTGIIDAAIKAVETVDKCVGKIYQKLQENHGVLLLTADHGNADYMLTDNNETVTTHSLNPVPFIITDTKYTFVKPLGKLADIAPTLLTMLNIPVPREMTGEVLIKIAKE